MSDHSSSRAKKPEIVKEARKLYRVAKVGWVAISAPIVVLGILAWTKIPSKPPPPPAAAAAAAPRHVGVTEMVTLTPGVDFVVPTKDWKRHKFTPIEGCFHMIRPDRLEVSECAGKPWQGTLPPNTVAGEYVLRLEPPSQMAVVEVTNFR